MIPFGEKVWYKQLKDGDNKKNALENRYQEGLWIGHARGSNSILIGTTKGVVKAWSVKTAGGGTVEHERHKGHEGNPAETGS